MREVIDITSEYTYRDVLTIAQIAVRGGHRDAANGTDAKEKQCPTVDT